MSGDWQQERLEYIVGVADPKMKKVAWVFERGLKGDAKAKEVEWEEGCEIVATLTQGM